MRGYRTGIATRSICLVGALLLAVTAGAAEPKDLPVLRESFRLQPIPAALESARGQHPRLYLDATRVAALRQAMQTTHASFWQNLRASADRLAKSGPPAYREKDTQSGDEQLWQREVGNAMPVLALAWQLSGDRRYLDGARAWALASCHYSTWGLGRADGMDLAAGHQLYGMGLVPCIIHNFG